MALVLKVLVLVPVIVLVPVLVLVLMVIVLALIVLVPAQGSGGAVRQGAGPVAVATQRVGWCRGGSAMMRQAKRRGSSNR